MKKQWKYLIVIGFALFFGINLYLDIKESKPAATIDTSGLNVGINKGELAPDFEGVTLTGETIRLSDLRGKTVVINLFASWCGPCQLEAPHLAQVFAELGGDEVAFIGLNLEESVEEVSAFQEEYGWEFPVVLNQDGKLTEIYRPLGLPTSWFIDPNGIIQYVHTGPVTADMLSMAIINIREGREPNSIANLDGNIVQD